MANTQMASQHVVVQRSRHSGGWVVNQIVYWVAGVIEIVLAFRFGLRLLGANPEATFTEFIYRISAPLVAPFEAVFGVSEVEGAVFEWSTLLAMLVYAVIAWGITALISGVTPNSSTRVEEVEDTREVR